MRTTGESQPAGAPENAAAGRFVLERPEPHFWRRLLMRLRLRDRRFYPLFNMHAHLCTEESQDGGNAARGLGMGLERLRRPAVARLVTRVRSHRAN